MAGEKLLESLNDKSLKGDVFSEKQKIKSVIFESNRFKSVELTQTQGFGVRLLNQHNLEGFSYSNVENINVVEKALELAQFGEKVSYTFPSAFNYPKLKLFHKDVLALKDEDLIEKGNLIIEKLLKSDESLSVSTDFSYGFAEASLLNTSGFKGSYEKTYYSFSVSATRVKNDEISDISEYLSLNSTNLNIDKAVNLLLEKLELSKNNANIENGEYPIIFSPKAMRNFMQILLNGFNGKLIEKGVSPIIDRIGKKCGSELLTVIDNPLSEEMLSSQPFDDEGLELQKIALIDKGVIKQGIFDLKTASKLSVQSSGAARRSYSSMPSPSFSNLIVMPGNSSEEQMIKSIKKGIYADQFLGAGQSNIMAGEFSANLDLAFVIENGEKIGRVKDKMISANVFDMISKIKEVSDNPYVFGSSSFPAVLFDNIQVTG